MRIVGITLIAAAGAALAACGGRPRPVVLAPAPPARAAVAAVPAFEPATATDEIPEVMVVPPRPAPVGSLPDGALLRAMRRHELELRHCFAWALGETSHDSSYLKVRVHLRIGARGRVLRATAAVGNARLQACLAAVALRFRFPAPGAPLDVDLPLIYDWS